MFDELWLGLLAQILEPFAQTGKSMADTMDKMNTFDINLKAKRSKAKVRNDDKVLTAVIRANSFSRANEISRLFNLRHFSMSTSNFCLPKTCEDKHVLYILADLILH